MSFPSRERLAAPSSDRLRITHRSRQTAFPKRAQRKLNGPLLTGLIKSVYTRMRPSAPSFKACQACACSALRRASRAVTQHYERHFRGSGLRATQFTILATLAQAGPLSISELSDQLGIDRTTLSRNLRLIEDQGWISALAHGDQRVRKMALSPRGRKKASAALAFWKQADTSVEPVLRRFGLQSRPMVRAE
ncbi:MAG: hypothetical protein DME69_12625 [Verrucomicrobia bacterium]|nr:MAG: hypothetical protein DME69_12625 [Verrucomicrobiota bacterium]